MNALFLELLLSRSFYSLTTIFLTVFKTFYALQQRRCNKNERYGGEVKHTSQQAHILSQWKKEEEKLKNESSESSVLNKSGKTVKCRLEHS